MGDEEDMLLRMRRLVVKDMAGHTQTIASLAQLGADIDAVENELILEVPLILVLVLVLVLVLGSTPLLLLFPVLLLFIPLLGETYRLDRRRST